MSHQSKSATGAACEKRKKSGCKKKNIVWFDILMLRPLLLEELRFG